MSEGRNASDDSDAPVLDRAYAAMDRRAFGDAYELLAQADGEQKLTPEELPLLADAAYMAGHPDVALHAWERVHAAALKAGDKAGAIGAALRVCFGLTDAARLIELRVWERRVEALLADQPESAANAILAMLKGTWALWSGDVEAALELSRRAIDIASRSDDSGTVVIARIVEARALILLGALEEGIALLDEAAMSATTGELDPFGTGIVYCGVVCAFQALTDYERSQLWTEAMERWRASHGFGGFQGRCRVHRAEMLRLRGQTREAETEAQLACQEFAVYIRGDLGWPQAELGQIRLRLGNLRGAEEAFLQGYEAGWDPQPGLALVRLAQGNVRGAADMIRGALEEPSTAPTQEALPNTELRRAPLLAAQTEIALAAEDTDRARWATGQLEGIAATYGTKALRATAAVARASVQLADGDSGSARSNFQQAVSLWTSLNAPYETARARVGLAKAHRAAGNREQALLDFTAARSTFERLGATLDARRAAQEMEAVGAPRSTTAETKVFMFTDIVRSTNLIEAIGDEAWTDLLGWHDHALRTLFDRHHGEEVSHPGDGFFVAFNDPGEALACAEAIQQSLSEHRRDHGFAPFVRIGLHQGEATRTADNLQGMGVHQAARIGALAGGGEILASLVTLRAAGRDPEGADIRTVNLKGVSEPVEVVAVAWR